MYKRQQKEWAENYALSDPKGFTSSVEKTPQVVPMGKLDMSDDAKNLKSAAASEKALLVCKALDVSKEDIGKYGKG